jgi:hypothetical protein
MIVDSYTIDVSSPDPVPASNVTIRDPDATENEGRYLDRVRAMEAKRLNGVVRNPCLRRFKPVQYHK